jgi:hypothetical protein
MPASRSKASHRADSSSIREGAAKCVIEGTFDVTSYNLRPFFEENDMEYDDECIIRRELSSGGKSRAFVNDTPASLAQLKALGNRLIDIHSQHQNLLLNTESFQMEVLDTLAGNQRERAAYQEAFKTFCSAEQALRKAEEEREKNKADEDYLRFQLQQFDELVDAPRGMSNRIDGRSFYRCHANARCTAWRSAGSTSRIVGEGIVKAWSPKRTPRALRPTTRPAVSTSGPPELPGLIAASVWYQSV